jgi:hypothetical protein
LVAPAVLRGLIIRIRGKIVSAESDVHSRRDALVVAGLLVALGILWLLLKLYWQGALLVAAAGAVAFFAGRAAPAAEPAKKSESPRKTSKKVAGETSSRQKKRKRKR